MSKTAVGLYPDRRTAEKVVEDLVRHGFARHNIRIGARLAGGSTGVPDHYWEGLSDDAVAVAVTSEENQGDQAVDLLNRHEPIDVEERIPMTRSAGVGISPPENGGTLQTGRKPSEGGGARVFIW